MKANIRSLSAIRLPGIGAADLLPANGLQSGTSRSARLRLAPIAAQRLGEWIDPAGGFKDKLLTLSATP